MNSKTRTNARAGVGDLDARIEQVLTERGALDPLVLVQLLRAQPGDVIDRVVALTLAGAIAAVGGRFVWRGRS